MLLARADRDPSPANLEALERWRLENTRQSAALASGDAVLRDSVRLPRSNPASAPRGASDQRRPFALAASLAAGLIGGALYFAWYAQRPGTSLEAVLLTTKVGEPREVRLGDGSKLTLDTATSVRLMIGRGDRRAVVDSGRARFTIAATRSPFVIRTGPTAVRVAHGVIDVTSAGLKPDIDVIAGNAQVDREDKGGIEHLEVTAPASIRASGASIELLPARKSDDWPSGRLSFAGAPLADVVQAANRYSRVKIIIGDAAVAKLKVTGVFKSSAPEALANSLAIAFGLRLERNTSGDLVLRSQSPSH